MAMLSAEQPTTAVHQLHASAEDYRSILEENVVLLTQATKPDVVRATVQSVKYYANRLADVMEELEANQAAGDSKTTH